MVLSSSSILKGLNCLLVAHPQLTTAKHGKHSPAMACKSRVNILMAMDVSGDLNFTDSMD